jgi:hypothetical protein
MSIRGELMKKVDNDEKKESSDEDRPEEWFSSGGWLSTSKWFWISLAVLVILAVIFKR